MFKDITLGQYYPVDSPIHRLDPRVKLVGTLVYVVMLFIGKSFFMYIPATVLLVLVVVLSNIPVSYILRGIKPIIPLIIISAAFNIFMTPGNILTRWWIFNITDSGIYMAVFMAVRLLYLIAGASIMTLATTPTKLTDGLETGLRFLIPLKVPVHEIAMMMSIALRFIPILVDETDKIRKAQMARGADFESGGIIKRAKAMIPLLVPLFVSAFRRANDLAMAMEARCYHGAEGRTRMKPLKYAARDRIAYIILAVYVVTMILVKIFVKL